MRVQAFTTSLLALGLFGAPANARPTRPAHHTAENTAAHRHATVSAHARPAVARKGEPVKLRNATRNLPLQHHGSILMHAKTARISREDRRTAPSHTAVQHGTRPDAQEKPRVARVQQPLEETSANPGSQPEPAAEPIHVHHNRKAHLSADAAPKEAAPTAEPPVPPTGSQPHPQTASNRALRQDVSGPEAVAAEPSPLEAAAAPAPAAPHLDKHPVKLTVSNAAPSVTLSKSHIVVKAPVEEVIPTQVIMPALYTKSGRLIIPPALKGSHEILVHQNWMADRDGLDRVQDDADLESMRDQKMLIALPASGALEIDERLPSNRRYCRPWTAQFLSALARAHYARFHSPLQVNSAVRTVEFQQRLRYTNGNAAPAEGSTASPHLTGQAVDLAKHGLSMTEIAWLRGYLLPLVQAGKVDVEEEFQQACFHISVYRKYMPDAAPHRNIEARRGNVSVIAAAVH